MEKHTNDQLLNEPRTPHTKPPADVAPPGAGQYSEPDHPLPTELEAYLHRKLSVDSRERLERHIGTCRHCIHRLAQLSALQTVRHQHWRPLCIALAVVKEVPGLDANTYRAEVRVKGADRLLPFYEVFDRLLVAGARAKVPPCGAAYHRGKTPQSHVPHALEMMLNGGQTSIRIKWNDDLHGEQPFDWIYFHIVDSRFTQDAEGTLLLVALYEKERSGEERNAKAELERELVINTLDPWRLPAEAAPGLKCAFEKEELPWTKKAWRVLADRTLQEQSDPHHGVLDPALYTVFEEIRGEDMGARVDDLWV